MTPQTSTPASLLAHLGEALVSEGFAGSEAELAAVAARVRRLRTADAAADVLVDRNAPEVARFRAFAVVCRALSLALPFEPTGPVALPALAGVAA